MSDDAEKRLQETIAEFEALAAKVRAVALNDGVDALRTLELELEEALGDVALCMGMLEAAREQDEPWHETG